MISYRDASFSISICFDIFKKNIAETKKAEQRYSVENRRPRKTFTATMVFDQSPATVFIKKVDGPKSWVTHPWIG